MRATVMAVAMVATAGLAGCQFLGMERPTAGTAGYPGAVACKDSANQHLVAIEVDMAGPGPRVDTEYCEVDRGTRVIWYTRDRTAAEFAVQFPGQSPIRGGDPIKLRSETEGDMQVVALDALNVPGTYAYDLRVGADVRDPAIIIR